MIFDNFGNKINDDGTPINAPLSGALPDLSNEVISPTQIKGGTSSNFKTGVSGYFLDNTTGDVEFGSGKFRGDISGSSGTFGNLHINSPSNTIIVNDGTNDRVLIGYLAGKF